jgi:hypothetical protein
MAVSERAKRRCSPAAILLAAMATLVGCAGERKPFDTAGGPTLDRILLPPAGQPATYSAAFANPLYVVFGIPGAIVGENVEQSTHGIPFTEAAHAGGVDLGTALTALIKDELAKSGHDIVSVTPAPSRPQPNALFADYGSFLDMAGAPVLDVAIVDAGYRGTMALPYRPFMWAVVRLVDPKTGRTIYADRLEYDPTSGAFGFRLVGRPAPDCSFSTREELMADMQKAGECLAAGARLIARAVASDLQGKR